MGQPIMAYNKGPCKINATPIWTQAYTLTPTVYWLTHLLGKPIMAYNKGACKINATLSPGLHLPNLIG
jgi:hypothetical protein